VNEDKSIRYQRLKRRAGIASLVWNAALLVAILGTGATLGLRALSEAIGLSSTAISRVAYVVLLSAVTEAASLPLAYYSGYLLEKRYGLSTETIGAWVRDQAKSFAIGIALGGAAVLILYPIIGSSPEGWWLPAGLVFALLIVGLANLAPVLLLPLFYTVKPLERESLRTRLLGLAERAGARVLGAYEWGLGEKTKKANAALAGLGATRRILVSDTMLADYTDEEIEVVLAHELAHHVHGDIWKGIAFESTLVLAGFYAAGRLLWALAPSFGLRGPADIAGLPLLLLAAGAVSVVMVPVAYAMTRAFERSADHFALQLTRNPQAFISAMRRLSAQNLAEESPSKIVEWLFHSHPPIRERIAAAEAFRSPT
jgi:STE24 endopeptidase